MVDVATSTEDLPEVMPKLVNELIILDEKVKVLENELYALKFKNNYTKLINEFNLFFIYTLPWNHLSIYPYKIRFYKSNLIINKILLGFTKNQVDFIYNMHCNLTLPLDIFYFVQLFDVYDYY